MTVYVVAKTRTQTFSNDLCWDDGYYDDYYEDVVSSDEIVGIFATEELAKAAAEKEDEQCDVYDTVYWYKADVMETKEQWEEFCKNIEE